MILRTARQCLSPGSCACRASSPTVLEMSGRVAFEIHRKPPTASQSGCEQLSSVLCLGVSETGVRAGVVFDVVSLNLFTSQSMHAVWLTFKEPKKYFLQSSHATLYTTTFKILRREGVLEERPKLSTTPPLTDNYEVIHKDLYDKPFFLPVKTPQPKNTRIRCLPFDTECRKPRHQAD